MRVLYLSPCAQLGGAERCLLDIMAAIRKSQPYWDLHLIAAEEGPLLREAAGLGVSTKIVCFPPSIARLGAFGVNPARIATQLLSNLGEAKRYRADLQQAIREIAPSLIHTNGFKMHLLGAWDGTAPVIWHLHDFPGARALQARALRLSAPRCSLAIGVSESVTRDAEAVFGSRTRLQTVLNAVDLRRFHPEGETLNLDTLAELPPPEATPLRVGLIATFAKWKGHELFLRAMSHPEVRRLGVRGYVIGGPIYRTAASQYGFAELREMARRLNVEGSVGLTGFVDSAAAMRSLDIVVHASTEPEPFGLVIAEAMATGTAVIAANAGGTGEIFTNGRDALGFAPGDERALAEAITTLCTNPITRLRIARAARETAEKRFDRLRLGSSFPLLYKQVLESCASSTSIAAISTAA